MRTLPEHPVAPYKLAHVVIRTAHLDEAVDYYSTLLNARVIFDQRPFACGLTYDEEHHRLALVAVPDAEGGADGSGSGEAAFDASTAVRDAQGADLTGVTFRADPGLDHIAFTFDSLASLLATYVRAKRDGIEPTYCINHGATVSFYYTDPDGNRTELQVDAMPMELADEYLQSDVHQANPIGWPFSPDELVDRFLGGDPLTSLMAIGREAITTP